MVPEARDPSVAGELPPTHGLGPPYEVADLPAPLPFSARNAFRVIGPGAILLATAIGGGEWIVGPAQGVQHGLSLFWIATMAIVLQVAFNLEAARYTLYTGEPIYGGILRLWPGPRFWGGYYSLVGFLQLGSPALALLCASTIFSVGAGRIPADQSPADQLRYQLIAVGLILLVVGILLFGGIIERMLERASWFMLVFIFAFLIYVNVAVVPADHWLTTLKGFLGGIPFPEKGKIDWGLLSALAATAGSGGLGNLTVTNWMRDKGFAMGALTGAIPSAVGARQVRLSHTGIVFPVSAATASRFRQWMRYVTLDQVWVWGLFCFLGMFLNVNLMTHIATPGENLTGIAAGSYQAQSLVKDLGPLFWYLTLLNGFWILFSTQLGNTDILVRTTTDVLWLASHRLRAWRGGDVRRVYYSILVAFSIWGLCILWWGTGAEFFKILANLAGLVLAVAGFQVFLVNRRFLPRALRPPWWREGLVLACSAFYTFFTALWLWELYEKKVLEAMNR